MKLLFLSCSHGDKKFLDIPTNKIDAVFLAGDFGKADKARELRMKYPEAATLSDKVSKKELAEMTEEYVGTGADTVIHFSRKPVFFIFGNVEQPKEVIEARNKKYGISVKPFEDRIAKTNAQDINMKVISFGGLTIAGLSYFVEKEWVKEFLGKDGHTREDDKIEEELARNFLSKLEKVDILITHNPPKGHLDLVKNPIVPKNWNGKHAGSYAVLDYIKRKQPKYVVCGHIHEAAGEVFIGKTKAINTACRSLVLEA